MRSILWIVASVIIVLSAVNLAFTLVHVREERTSLSTDLEHRTRLLAESLKESIEPAYSAGLAESLQRTVSRFVDQERLRGLVVMDARGEIVAASSELPVGVRIERLASEAMDADSSRGEFVRGASGSFYLYASPLREELRVIGALFLIQNAGFIDAYIGRIWWDNLTRLAVQILFFSIIIAAIVRWVIVKPLSRLAESVRRTRAGSGTVGVVTEHSFFFQPLASEIAKLSKSLSQARSAASEEARMRLEKLDTPWTAERLKEFVKAHLRNRPIVLVSNREPYVHEKAGSETKWSVPASGMVTALEPVMEACGGLWVAHGSGNADREVADAQGKVQVPPEEPRYTLKRVWLTQKDVQGFYVGFSNEALWPLSHMAHTRPVFRKNDWMAYRALTENSPKLSLRR